jgi:hypothetical protein
MRETMKKQFCAILAAMFVTCTLGVVVAFAQNLSFDTLDGNSPEIEKRGVITGASLAADFDGEGVNNDVALIDQGRGLVLVLLYNKQSSSPKSIGTIDVSKIFSIPLVPTSATAFIDSSTGLQNIAITAIVSPITDSNEPGKLIIGINDGSGSFSNSSQFQAYNTSPGPTDINHGDFNNDSFDDLIFIDFRVNTATVAINDSSNRFSRQNSHITDGIEPVSAVIGDFNDDDHLDFVVLNRGGSAEGGKSTVRTLFGDGKGNLFLSENSVQVSNFGISMAGGLVDITGLPAVSGSKPLRRIADFNDDGFSDVAVLSTGSGNSEIPGPVITLLFNNPLSPGLLRPRPPIELIDNFTKKPNGFTVAASNGGAESVSGLGFGTNPLGVGGAYHALAAADLNASGTVDLIVSSSAISSVDASGSEKNIRAVVYLVGESLVFDDIRFTYSKNPVEDHDTFVAAVPGAFAQSDAMIPGVLHVSLNGNIWIDRNNLGPFFCGRAPFLNIKRSDLNASFPGGGRKEIVVPGQSIEIPVSAFELSGGRITFRLSSTNTGQNPPPFVTLKDNGNNTATIKINAPLNIPVQDELTFPIVVEAIAPQNPPPGFGCGRLPLAVHEHFTLVVHPNSPPAIDPIPDQTLRVNKTATIQLSISDRDNQSLSTSVKCDRGNFVTVNGNLLTIAPLIGDIGKSSCTVTVKDEVGLSSSATFFVEVKPEFDVLINSVQYGAPRLTIMGSGFGTGSLLVKLNGIDISRRIISQSETLVTLKGGKRRLGLKGGANDITITVNGMVSNTFVFNLPVGQIRR